MKNGSDGGHDFFDYDLYPLVLVAHGYERICAGGSVVSNICDAATQCRHRTALGVDRSPVANGISLDTIFCIVKRRLAKSARDHVAGITVDELKG